MEKIRISAVRYANTYPFIYGLSEKGFYSRASIETDHPSDCAAKLISGKADLGLIPVGAIPLIKESHIIGDYCIGADGKVRTVQMMSNCTVINIRRIYLDYRSVTSVKLVKVLARNHWKKEFIWTDTTEGFDFGNIDNKSAVVLIGDQCFEYEDKYLYKSDLAEEWKKFSGLPFVFACWISNRVLSSDFVKDFNNALSYGVRNIDLVVNRFSREAKITGSELRVYLTRNIDYSLDSRKREAMDLFIDLLKEL